MEQIEGVFVGIDISARNTLISFYKQNMEEPATVSTVVGAENFAIPTVIGKKFGISQWYFGDEAIRQAKAREATLVEELYTLALKKELVVIEGTSYEARELLVIFFKKLFSIPGAAVAADNIAKLIVCVEQVDLSTMELMNFIASRINVDSKKLMLVDRRESFYYYALSQKPELFLYNVALFDYSGLNMVSTMLHRNQTTRPQVINLDVVNHGELGESRDTAFEQIVVNTFGSQLISAVYLVGDGFDGDWMKTSLTKMCRGRKVFLGKNLYSKGACYAGYIRESNVDWPFLYIGDNDLKLNLSIKIYDNNELRFLTLIDAGESWYDAKGECEVILDGDREIEFYIQRPDSREAHVEVLELIDLPQDRENRTTRLRIQASPVSDVAIAITITDLGFGEISPSSGQSWEHTISLE